MDVVAGSRALWERGRIRDAYELSRRTLPAPALYREHEPPLETAHRWHEHGRLCWHNAQFPECERSLMLAYHDRCTLLGKDHLDTLATLERLAALAHYQLNFDLANRRFEEVIGRLEATHPDEDVRAGVALRNYATSLRDKGWTRQARETIDRAKTILSRRLSDQDDDMVATFKADAWLCVAEGNPTDALRGAEMAIKFGSRRWEYDHPLVAATELIAASAEMRQGRYRPARKRLDHAMHWLERAYGPHPLVAIALERKARLELWADGDLDEAEAAAARACTMYFATYPDNVSFAVTWLKVLLARDKIGDASRLVERRPVVELVETLANILVDRQCFAEAVPWIERARDEGKPEHREAWQSMLDECKQELGRSKA